MKANKDLLEKLGIKLSEFSDVDKTLPIIRSKFYTGFFGDDDAMIKYIKNSICNRRKMYETYLKEQKYSHAVFIAERPFRLDVFLELQDEILQNKGLDHTASIVADIWIDSENPYINYDVWYSLFCFYGNHLMSKNEKIYYDKLPEKITVYHGIEGENDPYIAWTLSEKVANFFAKRFSDSSRGVVTEVIPKSKAVAYLNNRHEEEILILDKKIRTKYIKHGKQN